MGKSGAGVAPAADAPASELRARPSTRLIRLRSPPARADRIRAVWGRLRYRDPHELTPSEIIAGLEDEVRYKGGQRKRIGFGH